jgi:hypothetical protein
VDNALKKKEKEKEKEMEKEKEKEAMLAATNLNMRRESVVEYDASHVVVNEDDRRILQQGLSFRRTMEPVVQYDSSNIVVNEDDRRVLQQGLSFRRTMDFGLFDYGGTVDNYSPHTRSDSISGAESGDNQSVIDVISEDDELDTLPETPSVPLLSPCAVIGCEERYCSVTCVLDICLTKYVFHAFFRSQQAQPFAV